MDGGRFEGEWIDDKVHGRGVSLYASGNRYQFHTLSLYASGITQYVRHVPMRRRYEGEWVDGKINGQGTLWYADGDSYQGEWKDGKMHGRMPACMSIGSFGKDDARSASFM